MKNEHGLPLIGWREWVSLPQLGVPGIKAKIDTGARSSSIHAWNMRTFLRHGAPWIRFDVHPLQRDSRKVITCEAPIVDQRDVRSSSGHKQERYVIVTDLKLGEMVWPIELTLANRDEMGFRLLLGRTALRRRFLINPGRSYLMGRPAKTRKRKENAS